MEGSGTPAITAQHSHLTENESQYETLGMIDEYLLASVDLTDQHSLPPDPYTRSMALRLFDTLDPDHPALVASYEFVNDWNPYRGHFLVDGDFIFVIGKSDVVILRLIRQAATPFF